jgi:hypothetical protein
MPNSVFSSAGGASATQFKAAIDSSVDIEQLKQDVTAIKDGLKDTEILTKLEAVRQAIVSLVFPISTRIPQLRPAIVGTMYVVCDFATCIGIPFPFQLTH